MKLESVAWQTAPLEAVADVILGQSPPGDTYNDVGTGLPFFQGKAEFRDLYPIARKWCRSPKKLAEPDDVLLSVRAPVGPTNLCPTTACIGRGLAAIRPRGNMPARYLLYALRATAPVLAAKGTGSTFDAVSGHEVRRHLIPVAPAELQPVIVAEIEKQFSRLDVGVAALKRVQSGLKRYRAAVLKAACEGKLVPTEAELARQEGRGYETGALLLERILMERRARWTGRDRYRDPAAPHISASDELPPGWAWATAEQVCEFITKGTTPAAAKMQEGAGDIQFLKVYNLTFTGRLNADKKPVFITRSTHEGELVRSIVRRGDILINIVGPPLGQVSVVPEALPEANINQAIARFRAVCAQTRPYLAICFGTEPVIGWAIMRAKTTAGQSNLTLELCRGLPIPLPPLAEQERIVAEVERRLSLAEEIEATVEAGLKRAATLRQAVLQRAFGGDRVS